MSKRNNSNPTGRKRKGVTFSSDAPEASAGPASDFDFLNAPEDADRIEDENFSSKFPHTNLKLRLHCKHPAALEVWMKRNKKKHVHFIKYKKTPDIQGESLCDRMERWYGTHVIVLHKKTGAEKVACEQYIRRDPLGLIPIPNSDTKCWKLRLSAQTLTVTPTATATGGELTGAAPTRAPYATRSQTQTEDEQEEEVVEIPDDAELQIPAAAVPQQVQTYVKTQFFIDLEFMQARVYAFLRAGAILFMDKTCASTLKVWIEKTERDMGDDLTDANRLRIGTRISWANIRAYIVEKFCVPTLGSFHFLPLFKMKRKVWSSSFIVRA